MVRHLLANLVLYGLATLLLAGAALFAFARSEQLVLSDEAALLARWAPAAEREFQWEELGDAAYLRNCMNCHGRDGEGWDQYPGLSHVAALFAAPGGRDYLIDLHLYGLTSNRWRAAMPSMGHMHDIALAAVLNRTLASFGNVHGFPADALLYLPEDVAGRRGQGLSPWEVNARRPPIP